MASNSYLNTTFVHVNLALKVKEALKRSDLNTTFVHVNQNRIRNEPRLLRI